MILVPPFAVAFLISACFGVGVVSGHPVSAQSRWRTYTPSDKSFTVEVPVTPHSDSDDYEGGEASPGGWKPTHSYMAVASILQPRVYSVSVFELTPAARRAVDKGIDELIQEMAGKNYRLTSSSQMRVARGRGREVTLARKDTDENLFTRMRFIDLGARVYLLTYVTDTADDVYSRHATRFFDSFKAKR